MSSSGELQLAVLQKIFDALKKNEWSGIRAAIELGMCDKTLRKYRRELVRLGWPVEEWKREGKSTLSKQRKKYKARVDYAPTI